ncbi:hypothetical protein AYO44_13355 [Planctomycetaceae bacterium SCGC AG-212-F19]|nr:hypothetical protein AYO44_13355 [Planctomycetaceae bacterium SCGC AG-212-F19]
MPLFITDGEQDIPLTSMEEVRDLLAGVINRTLRGQMDSKVANTIANIVNIFVRCFEGAELEKRLEGIEKSLPAKRKSA